jgi:S-adenosylmethionine-diacylgycerolhomoserine-N-methlytransferase
VFIPASNQPFDQDIARGLQFCDSRPTKRDPDEGACHMPVARTSQGGSNHPSAVAGWMSAHSFEIGEEGSQATDAMRRMNRMYRWQRHIYDASRRYYLLGRDRMIANLRPAAGANVLEIGCGTGRNLVRAARRYPQARFFGVDVSTEMLASAKAAIARAGLTGRIALAQADATSADPQILFAVPAFDAVIISYSLSMIPEWRTVLAEAARLLNPCGRLHVVDFGDLERLPAIRAALLRWLAWFGVTPRGDLERELSALALVSGADLTFERPFRGYAQYAVLTSSSRTMTP